MYFYSLHNGKKMFMKRFLHSRKRRGSGVRSCFSDGWWEWNTNEGVLLYIFSVVIFSPLWCTRVLICHSGLILILIILLRLFFILSAIIAFMDKIKNKELAAFTILPLNLNGWRLLHHPDVLCQPLELRCNRAAVCKVAMFSVFSCASSYITAQFLNKWPEASLEGSQNRQNPEHEGESWIEEQLCRFYDGTVCTLSLCPREFSRHSSVLLNRP